MKKLFVLVLVFSAVMLASEVSFAQPEANIVNAYQLDAVYTGIAWDGSSLWHGDRFGTDILQSSTDGTPLQNFIPPAPVHDLAWDGAYLWMDSPETNAIYQIDTSDGSVVHTIAAPAGGSMGLTYDGTYLWSTRPGSDITKLDPVTGAVLDTISSPANLMGLGWDGNYLWSTIFQGPNGTSNTLLQIDPTDGSVINSVDLGLGGIIHDLDWGDGYLWLAGTGSSPTNIENSAFFQVEVTGLTVVPEPVSSILFLTGGAAFGARRYFGRTGV